MGRFFMRRHRQSLWANSRLSLAVSSMLGILFLLITAVLISGFAFLFISDFRLLRFISLVPVFTGAFSGAFICGKYRRRKGLISGIVCGIIIYALICAAGAFFTGRPTRIGKLFLLVTAGAAGGITGVNSKRPKSLRD